jgi:hypothetical protein
VIDFSQLVECADAGQGGEFFAVELGDSGGEVFDIAEGGLLAGFEDGLG